MPKEKRPRRGSKAFWPRKRARRIYPRIKSYPEIEKVKPLAFAGYKAGMKSVVLIDNNKNSPSYGQEITMPVTVIECPPLFVCGFRIYTQTTKGLKSFTEVWTEKLPKEIERKVKIGKVKDNSKKIEENIDKIKEIKLIVCTQPKISGLGKKTPEIFEIPIGGKDIKEKFEFAKNVLGKELSIDEVFSNGELVDVIAVTKGKGTAGPVKRFGVKIQPRHAKEKRRHIGTLGTQSPGKVRPTVPQAGQLGFQTRTEYNKRILLIEDGQKIVPKGGFKHYGITKSKAILIHGSVPGTTKRLVVLRCAIRPTMPRILPLEIKEVI